MSSMEHENSDTEMVRNDEQSQSSKNISGFDSRVTSVKKKVDGADTRSFWTMVLLSVQNAFNDKAAQTMLIALGVFLANAAFKLGEGANMSLDTLAEKSAEASANISPSFAILILIPFIFLAPIAGWISDRYSKTRVLRAGALMQMVVLGFIFWSVQIVVC